MCLNDIHKQCVSSEKAGEKINTHRYVEKCKIASILLTESHFMNRECLAFYKYREKGVCKDYIYP